MTALRDTLARSEQMAALVRQKTSERPYTDKAERMLILEMHEQLESLLEFVWEHRYGWFEDRCIDCGTAEDKRFHDKGCLIAAIEEGEADDDGR